MVHTTMWMLAVGARTAGDGGELVTAPGVVVDAY